jgi:hypothetical protein
MLVAAVVAAETIRPQAPEALEARAAAVLAAKIHLGLTEQ